MPIRLNDATLAPAVRQFLDAGDTSPNDNLLTKEEAIQQWGSLKDFQQQLAGRFNLFADFDKGKVTAIFRKPFETEAVLMTAAGSSLIGQRFFEFASWDILNLEDRDKLRDSGRIKELTTALESSQPEADAIATATEKIIAINSEYSNPHHPKKTRRETETRGELERQLDLICAINGMSRAGVRARIFVAIIAQALAGKAPDDSTPTQDFTVLSRTALIVFTEMRSSHDFTPKSYLNIEKANRRITTEVRDELRDFLRKIDPANGWSNFLEQVGILNALRDIESVPDLLDILMQEARFQTNADTLHNGIAEESLRELAQLRQENGGDNGTPLSEEGNLAKLCIDLIWAQVASDYEASEPSRLAVQAYQRRMDGLSDPNLKKVNFYIITRPVLEHLRMIDRISP